MADYKTIRGFKIRSVASDPTVDLGQLWYNTASNTIKFDSVGAGAWATGTAIPAATRGTLGFGSSTAAIMATGQTPPDSAPTTSFLWNGSSWAEDATVNNGRREGSGFGISSPSGAIVGGYSAALGNYAGSEEFDGTSWTALAAMNLGRTGGAAAGTVTAGMTMAGSGGPSGAMTDTTELWNGTAWTEVNDVNTARAYLGPAFQGTTTAAMIFGGLTPGASWGTAYKSCEQWNGVGWTEVNDLNTGRGHGGGAGTQTGALYYGGSGPTYPGARAETEEWNGTSWTEVGDLSGDRREFCTSNGTSTASLSIAGYGPPPTTFNTLVEVWNGAPAGVKTVTTS